MALLPDTSTADLGTTLGTATTETSKTYKMHVDDEQVAGSITDRLAAVQQAAYKILNTERYKHVIYSWDYGVELADLFGKPVPYVLSEIPRRIREALIQDDRIDDVVNFDLQVEQDNSKGQRGSIVASFTVQSIYGDLQMQKGVRI